MLNSIIKFVKASSKGSVLLNGTVMEDLVYVGSGTTELALIPKPKFEKLTNALVKTIKTNIFGTEQGILHGKNPSVKLETAIKHKDASIIEAVGAPAKFNISQKIVPPVGNPAYSIVHRRCVDLKVQYLWTWGITLATELLHTPPIKCYRKRLLPAKPNLIN